MTIDSLLWFCDQYELLEDQIKRGSEVYVVRYDTAPTICYINPSAAIEDILVDGIEIKKSNTVLPHHIVLTRGSTDG